MEFLNLGVADHITYTNARLRIEHEVVGIADAAVLVVEVRDVPARPVDARVFSRQGMHDGEDGHAVFRKRDGVEHRGKKDGVQSPPVRNVVEEPFCFLLGQLWAWLAFVLLKVDAVRLEVRAVHSFAIEEWSYLAQTRPEVQKVVTVDVAEVPPVVGAVGLFVRQGAAPVGPEPVRLRNGPAIVLRAAERRIAEDVSELVIDVEIHRQIVEERQCHVRNVVRDRDDRPCRFAVLLRAEEAVYAVDDPARLRQDHRDANA